LILLHQPLLHQLLLQHTATTTNYTAEPEKEKKEGFNSKTRFGLRLGGVISKQDYESINPTADS
jgi:hypothetical protein